MRRRRDLVDALDELWDQLEAAFGERGMEAAALVFLPLALAVALVEVLAVLLGQCRDGWL